MAGDASVNGFDEDVGGRHTRALAKRCIMLTEENKVRCNGALYTNLDAMHELRYTCRIGMECSSKFTIIPNDQAINDRAIVSFAFASARAPRIRTREQPGAVTSFRLLFMSRKTYC